MSAGPADQTKSAAAPSPAPSGGASTPAPAAAELQRVLWTRVAVAVRLSQAAMPMARVVELRPGTVLPLNKPADEPLEVLVNGRPVAAGRAVQVGENYGVRITGICGVEQLVRSLGARPDAAEE